MKAPGPKPRGQALHQIGWIESLPSYWMRRPDSNRCTRLCGPLPSHSATPLLVQPIRLSDDQMICKNASTPHRAAKITMKRSAIELIMVSPPSPDQDKGTA